MTDSRQRVLSPRDFEALIEDFHCGGSRSHRWTSDYTSLDLLEQALSSILKRDFSLKLQVIIFLEEFLEAFNLSDDDASIVVDGFVKTNQSLIESVSDGYPVKEQLLTSTTSVIIVLDANQNAGCAPHVRKFVNLLLTIINRPNHGADRNFRAVGCECLRQLEVAYPGLLALSVDRLWSLCRSERTHASQSYILLLASVIHNAVVLRTHAPVSKGTVETISSTSNTRKIVGFMLEFTHVLTPWGFSEFISLIQPLLPLLELQESMVKIQFYGLLFSHDPMLYHVTVNTCLKFQNGDKPVILRRLLFIISGESQKPLVFRLLALHWLLGMVSQELGDHAADQQRKLLKEVGLSSYPKIFDSLAEKCLKLHLLASVQKKLGDLGSEKEEAKFLKDGLVSAVSPCGWSGETTISLYSMHKLFMLMSPRTGMRRSGDMQTMVVDMMLESRKLVLVVVALIDRFLLCPKHSSIGLRLLEAFNEKLLTKVAVDYGIASYYPLFYRIARTDVLPPGELIELLSEFMRFLVNKHGPDTELGSWSHGSRVLSICRAMMSCHHSSTLFLPLSRLFSFTSLYFPDLDVRDSSRFYLRLIMSVPGRKLREILNARTGDDASSAAREFDVPVTHCPDLLSSVFLERLVPAVAPSHYSNALSVGTAALFGSADLPEEEGPTCAIAADPGGIRSTLRAHFARIPNLKNAKVRIPCFLRCRYVPDSCGGECRGLYATVLSFSSVAPYGRIPSRDVPFLAGVDLSDDSGGARVVVELEPVEPVLAPVDVSIETTMENGDTVRGWLHSIDVGIEDMFLPFHDGDGDVFRALWDACDGSSELSREVFPLRGGEKGVLLGGTASVKLLRVPADRVVRGVSPRLVPFVVGVTTARLADMMRNAGGGSIPCCITDSLLDIDDELGLLLVLICLPPRFHLLFQLQVTKSYTLVRIRTDYWPCLPHIDAYFNSIL